MYSYDMIYDLLMFFLCLEKLRFITSCPFEKYYAIKAVIMNTVSGRSLSIKLIFYER